MVEAKTEEIKAGGEVNRKKIDKCCLTCERLKICPIIKVWVELTEAPIEATTFYCSEYKQGIPDE